MTLINKGFLNLSEAARSKADAMASVFCHRWQLLCELYLPIKVDNSIWRFSRENKESDPSQGWKLHISATILDACALFEKVAPFLNSQDVQFKAPKSLDELSKINSGLQLGYPQIGKFITVYPATEKQTVKIARELHELTREFFAISVPFDKQYLPNSSVFYRYGGFASIEIKDEYGRTLPAIKNPAGKLVHDDRFQAVPEWLSNPFQDNEKNTKKPLVETPLTTTYKVFRAITQRGKGGTYQALDLSTSPPRFCVVKEGRHLGDVGWNGQDGYFLVKNEFEILKILRKSYKDVPQVFASFEIDGNFYLVMEYVAGKSLHDLMKHRRRRFSVKQVVKFSVEIAKIIEKFHKAGWVWNDCKPANLLFTHENSLRPIDFENSHLANQTAPFDWNSNGFSNPVESQILTKSNGYSCDLYALGAVAYFLLTGKLYQPNEPIRVNNLRRNVPKRLREIIESLLLETELKRNPMISAIRREFENILGSV